MSERRLVESLALLALGGLTVYGWMTWIQKKTIKEEENAPEKKEPEQSWKPGQNQPIPYPSKNWRSYQPSDLKAPGALYYLVISSIVPRPIALVTSQDKQGVFNCAPYSYFNVLSHDPPLIAIGCCMNMRSGTRKDTLANIETTGQFVVNIMSSWYLESANHTCGAFAPEVDELKEAGLTPLPSVQVQPPRVGEAAVQLECEVYNLLPIKNDQELHSVTIVIGRILRFHVHDGVLTAESTEAKPVVDWAKLSPVGRLGGDIFTLINNGREIPRPVVPNSNANVR